MKNLNYNKNYYNFKISQKKEINKIIKSKTKNKIKQKSIYQFKRCIKYNKLMSIK